MSLLELGAKCRSEALLEVLVAVSGDKDVEDVEDEDDVEEEDVVEEDDVQKAEEEEDEEDDDDINGSIDLPLNRGCIKEGPPTSPQWRRCGANTAPSQRMVQVQRALESGKQVPPLSDPKSSYVPSSVGDVELERIDKYEVWKAKSLERKFFSVQASAASAASAASDASAAKPGKSNTVDAVKSKGLKSTKSTKSTNPPGSKRKKPQVGTIECTDSSEDEEQ